MLSQYCKSIRSGKSRGVIAYEYISCCVRLSVNKILSFALFAKCPSDRDVIGSMNFLRHKNVRNYRE